MACAHDTLANTMTATRKIAPSILSADFARLGDQIAEIEEGGADQVHVDVMDGHFVPNITIGPVVVESIRKVTKLPLDVHLMIAQPDRYLKSFAASGADAITVHVETCPDIHATVQSIKSLGLRAGVALNPTTPLSAISSIVPNLDILLVMSVNPGFGGQKFIEESISRLEQFRRMLKDIESSADLSVDGGIGLDTAGRAARAGANVLVAGHSIFRSGTDIASAVRALRQATGNPV